MKEKKNEKKTGVVLQEIKKKTMVVNIKSAGNNCLMMDRIPPDVLQEILDKQTGKAKPKKKVRDPEQEVREATHIMSNGKVGFSLHGFKKGMIEATSFVGNKMFSKKLVKGLVRITNDIDGFIPIEYEKQTVRKHNIGAQTKFSPVFHNWKCKLRIEYESNNISAQDILTLINYAGFCQGIGMNRPNGGGGGSGEDGTYEVDTRK